ncbi:MAG: HAD family hydrolase [Gammaproteobacteria bacterium]|nr:HAD family hydrolase [Gammaproteobacteria bacterium]
MTFKAITLDLDDTLWPVWPTIRGAEAAANAWFAEHAPSVLEAWSSEGRMALRQRIVSAHPQRAHDLGFIRREMFRQMLGDCGHDTGHTETVYAIFMAARQRVSLYDGAAEALARLAARYPIVAISNGNADLRAIGLDQHFRGALSASDFGAAKPDPTIFHAACTALALPPDAVLHIGDDAHADVVGARRAGLRAGWINAEGVAWAHEEHAPEIEAESFAALVDQLL